MTCALRYLIIGFTLAAALQLWQDPPAWALLIAFSSGFLIGSLWTIAHMYFVDQLEKHGL